MEKGMALVTSADDYLVLAEAPPGLAWRDSKTLREKFIAKTNDRFLALSPTDDQKARLKQSLPQRILSTCWAMLRALAPGSY